MRSTEGRIIITEAIYKKMPMNIRAMFDKLPNVEKDEIIGLFPNSGDGNFPSERTPNNIYGGGKGTSINQAGGQRKMGDSGSAARFFYCAKASTSERNAGLDDLPDKTKVFNGQSNKSSQDMKPVEERWTTTMKNIHPTVKPVNLMRYLCRLTKTPTGGIVLDPFMGSGSTGVAAVLEGRHFIGIETNTEYCEIARRRIEYYIRQPQQLGMEI